MPWQLVTRACFIAAVAWAAALTRAFHPALLINVGVGVLLGALIVLIETRLRSTEVTDLLGALIGGAPRLRPSKTHPAPPLSFHPSPRPPCVPPPSIPSCFSFL